MNKIIYTQKDGTVAVIIPMDKYKVARCLKVKEISIYFDLLSEFDKKYKKNPDSIKDFPNSAEFLDDHLYLSSIPKEEWIFFAIDKIFTDEEYRVHVYERSIPKDAHNVREIADEAIPNTREFRNAWVDVTPDSKIDICCTKAKEWKLLKVRSERKSLLAQLDREQVIALGKKDNAEFEAIEVKKQTLRDFTNPIKALDTTDKINDEAILSELKRLSNLEEQNNGKTNN